MAGFKATGLFLLGALAGFGVALLVFVARVLAPIWRYLYLSSINAFLTGIVLVAVGLFCGVTVARCGKTLRLRTILGGIALLAVLLGVIVQVRRRTREFWALTLQHQAQATVLSAQYQAARYDPRVPKEQATDLLRLAHRHRKEAQSFDRAANAPWLPVPTMVPCGCPACATPVSSRSRGK